MSTFRDSVAALVGKETFVLLGGAPVKVTVSKLTDDLVILKLDKPLKGANELVIHVDGLQLVSA